MKFLASIAFAAAASVAFAGENAPDVAPDKSQFNLFNPTPREQMRDFNADRPSQTEGPFTVDAGHIQLELDFLNVAIDRHSPDNVRSETWNVEPLNIRLGVLNNLEFDMIFDDYVLSRTQPPKAHDFDGTSGFGDITLRFKLNLWGNEGGSTAVGLIPYIKLPLNASDLRNGQTEGGIILPVDVKLPGGWDLGMMTEWDFVTDGGAGYDSEFVNSIILGHGITKKLSGYIEFLSITGTASGFRWVGQVDGGLTYNLTPNTQLDIGCNFGVTKSAPDFNPFVGFAIRF